MRNLSLAIIGLTVLIISIFPSEFKGRNGNFEPFKSPHGADLKIRCDVCHSAESWKIDKKILSFDHNDTDMPLLGQHAQTDCKLCHPTLIFSEANSECAQCHTDVHESTVGQECSRCHTSYSWLVNNITQIHQQSRFPLVGVHATVDCYQCHISETLQRFEVIGTECYSCHTDDYVATTQPNHVTAGYSTQCDECHSIFAAEWTGAGFSHNFFPLTQGHDIDDCSRCHVNGVYTNTSSECISCHQADYNATTNPNHASANFSTNCTVCHSTAPGWSPATFDHSSFPLTLGHDIDDCSKCHINGNYTNTSGDCISCHQADYNATTNPSHASLNFSTNCTECHTTDPGWKPASYRQHDAQSFPIYSGNHQGEWNSCTDCHTNPSNYTIFSCIDCHEHNQNDMNNVHDDENGYVYNSVSCYNCHPRGEGDD